MKNFFVILTALVLVTGTTLPMHAVRAASAGDLVKCEDFNAVYYLAEDGKRYVFPNEHIYFSWYPDFHDVKTISCDDLSTLSLGERIVYQAGTRLVKIQSDPSVFVVEHDGVLREIPDEETAILLFGSEWSLRVDDVSEAFWSSFTVGDPLEEGEVPEGTILEDEDGNLFRVDDDGAATEIDPVLTTDQENVLEKHALSLEDIEEQLGIALALTRVDAEAAIEVLEALLARLHVVQVEEEDEEDEEDVEDFDEVEDEEDVMEDAQDAIEDAIEEIEEAEEDIAEDEEDDEDTTEAHVLLESAQEHLTLAQAAFDAGNFASAEEHADEARHDAMWARGKAVDHIAEDDEDVDEDEDADEDDVEVDDDEEDEDDENEGEMEDEDDSDDADESENSDSDSSGSDD